MFQNVKINLWWFIGYILLTALFEFLGEFSNWCNTVATYLFWIGGGAFIILVIIVSINFFTKKS